MDLSGNDNDFKFASLQLIVQLIFKQIFSVFKEKLSQGFTEMPTHLILSNIYCYIVSVY